MQPSVESKAYNRHREEWVTWLWSDKDGSRGSREGRAPGKQDRSPAIEAAVVAVPFTDEPRRLQQGNGDERRDRLRNIRASLGRAEMRMREKIQVLEWRK